MSKISRCPRCGSQAVFDFEEKMIYCTGCPLCVQDVTMNASRLLEIWNSLASDIKDIIKL